MRAKRQKLATHSVFDSVGIQLSRLQDGVDQRSLEADSVSGGFLCFTFVTSLNLRYQSGNTAKASNMSLDISKVT